MEHAVLKQNTQRITEREMFSQNYKRLATLAGSNLATCFAILKMSFYNVKSQEELLRLKGLKVRSGGKRKRYDEYLDFISAIELCYLNSGLRAILDKVGRANSEYAGFPFIYDELMEVGKLLRYDFFNKYNVLPEKMPAEEYSIKKVIKCMAQTRIEDFYKDAESTNQADNAKKQNATQNLSTEESSYQSTPVDPSKFSNMYQSKNEEKIVRFYGYGKQNKTAELER